MGTEYRENFRSWYAAAQEIRFPTKLIHESIPTARELKRKCFKINFFSVKNKYYLSASFGLNLVYKICGNDKFFKFIRS